MKNFFHLGVLIALSLVSVPAVRAAFNPAVVASDARWIVYADLNTLRESSLGKELVTAINQAQSEANGGVIGLNVPKLLTTVGSLTAYGSNLSNDPEAIDGALIAEGTADLRKIVESALLQATIAHPEAVSEVTDLPFPAYAIGNSEAAEGRHTKLVVAFPPEPIVIVSKSKTQVIKARDVFRGKAPSLARAANTLFPNLATLSKDAYIFAASVVPGDAIFPEKSPQTRLLQLTNSGALALGERGTDTFAHLELLASSDVNAEKLMKILQGLTAVLSMTETNDHQLADFLSAAAVTQENKIVTLRLAYPTARLMPMVEALRTRSANREGRAHVNTPHAITIGKTLAEWGDDDAATPTEGDPAEVALHTVDNVSLTNGSLITVGRARNGAKNARIDRVEILAADGSGMPLIFRQEFMRSVGGRGSMWQFAFPGAAGVYTLKVGYVNSPGSKARFAVSVTNPKDPAEASVQDSPVTATKTQR